VDREIHQPLLPPALAQQGLDPHETAVRQQAHPKLQAAVFLEKRSVAEVGVVEHQLVAEPRHVDEQHRHEDDGQPDQVFEGGTEGQNRRAAKGGKPENCIRPPRVPTP